MSQSGSTGRQHVHVEVERAASAQASKVMPCAERGDGTAGRTCVLLPAHRELETEKGALPYNMETDVV